PDHRAPQRGDRPRGERAGHAATPLGCRHGATHQHSGGIRRLHPAGDREVGQGGPRRRIEGRVMYSVALESVEIPDVAVLLGELDAHLGAIYPAESRHGLKLEALRAKNILFSLARDETGAAQGCGGIALLDGFAELKRMYVRRGSRGNGVGAMIVRFLERQAMERGYALMRLETGYMQHTALALYEGLGYTRGGAVPPYRPDPTRIVLRR